MTLHHVSLEIRREDVAAEVRFWAIVGFAQVAPPRALTRRSAWLARGGTQIHLLFADAPAIPAGGHAAIDVGGDYEATLQRLRDAGFAPEPRTEHWGAPRAFVRSPAGHRVELMRRAPG